MRPLLHINTEHTVLFLRQHRPERPPLAGHRTQIADNSEPGAHGALGITDDLINGSGEFLQRPIQPALHGSIIDTRHFRP